MNAVSAGLGYGFVIPSKIVEGVDDLEDLLVDNMLEFDFGGDSYDDNGKTLLFIKKSMISVSTYVDGGAKRINPDKMVVKVEWNKKLNAWAKEHKIAKPKIGWYLLLSVS